MTVSRTANTPCEYLISFLFYTDVLNLDCDGDANQIESGNLKSVCFTAFRYLYFWILA